MEPIIIDGLDITQEVIDEFRVGWELEAVQARLRMQRAQEFRRQSGTCYRRRGEFVHTAAVDPFWYHYWGQREGYQIWSDDKEVARFTRDTPEMKIEYGDSPLFHGWRPETAPEAPSAGTILLCNQFGTVTGAATPTQVSSAAEHQTHALGVAGSTPAPAPTFQS